MDREKMFRYLAVGAALMLSPAWAEESSQTWVQAQKGENPRDSVLAAYRALSASQSRNYDRVQDISARQMLLLLEVAERTGASLGQSLATGEHESARTWNDHVRPTLKNGQLGSAAGVWQFQPGTFHAIVREYGARLLALSGADTAAATEPMDLGDGPFTDAEVRRIIQDTVEGSRGAGDESLQLLRHNFAVLAFAKHFLSIDSGATSPEEDYLFHFLGAGEGRRVLALAQGEARDTLCVKPVEAPQASPETVAGADPRMALRRASALVPALPDLGAGADHGPTLAQEARPVAPLRLRLRGDPQPSALDGRITTVRSAAGLKPVPRLDLGYPVIPPFDFPTPQIHAPWGLPADSPTVTGNLGMFYRDGKGQTQPYTWGEFLENLARRVRADSQPGLVRAKYGVGFALPGGDLPQYAFNPEVLSEPAQFRHSSGLALPVPEALVTGPLDRDETAIYKQRLDALVRRGDDVPAEILPPESLATLRHLGLLPAGVQEAGAGHPQVSKALHGFRKLVGKDEPDDPANADRLMPAERIALELYDRRLAHYAALQASQQATAAEAPDLRRIAALPAGLRRPTAPHVAAVQGALAAQGLLRPPTKKQVWRDKRRKKHVAYKKVPFAGKADKATVAALDDFQLRNGLLRTAGVLDAMTLELLGLEPLGPEIFLPLTGPFCAIRERPETPSRCEVPDPPPPAYPGGLDLARPSPAPSFAGYLSGPLRALPDLEPS